MSAMLMRTVIRPALVLAGITVGANVVCAQEPAPPSETATAMPARASGPLVYAEFISQVLRANLDYATQRYNVTIAEAGLSIARLFPDPTLTAGIASTELYGPTHRAYPTAPTIGLGWTLELGGKRQARIALANDSLAQSQANLDDFLRQLKAEASAAFIDSLRARLVEQRKQDTLAALDQTVALDEVRLKAGDIGALELAQARVARDQFLGEATSAQSDAEVALAMLNQLAGGSVEGQIPQGSLRVPYHPIALAEAIESAQKNRADVIAAQRAVEVASDNLKLAHAQRWADVGVNLNYTHARAVYSDPNAVDKTGQPFPPDTPRNDALGATLTVPIPFSHLQHGELTQAQSALDQARLQFRAAQLQARTDVQSAHAQYQATAKALDAYDRRVLQEADQTLEQARYAYQHGAASLLDLLQVQRTTNDLYLASYDAQANAAKALLALMVAQGNAEGFELGHGG